MSITDTAVNTDTTTTDDRVRAILKVDDHLWRRFKAEAELQRRNPSQVAEDALRQYLDKKAGK